MHNLLYRLLPILIEGKGFSGTKAPELVLTMNGCGYEAQATILATVLWPALARCKKQCSDHSTLGAHLFSSCWYFDPQQYTTHVSILSTHVSRCVPYPSTLGAQLFPVHFCPFHFDFRSSLCPWPLTATNLCCAVNSSESHLHK